MAEDSDLYEMARAKMDAGDYVEAVRLFEASAAICPHFKTLELLGECRIHLGLLREAVVPLAAATTLNTQPRAPALLAEVLLRLGETEQATRIARLVLARNPTNKMALAVLRKLGADS
jgi:tetratricopeptide (TPR) repeat protein